MTTLSPGSRALLEEAVRRGLIIPDLPESIGAESFVDFVRRVAPTYRWYKHCLVLADVLQRVADGELKRVMIFMPPRHGKSELISRLFSAYYLRRFPRRWVGLNSYGAELASTLSRAARQHFLRAGGSIKDDAAAVKHWETTEGGGMWAAGVGGPILGKGWHLGIIDDPVKNSADAISEVVQGAHREWYESTFYTREEPDADGGDPDGAIVIINQRWGEQDLCGWLLSQEGSEDDAPERWHVVSFEAIKEAEPPELPATCTLEPDWREPGEALCPERRPIEKLRRIKKRISAYYWSALFQQRPRPREGNTFKWAWFKDRYVDGSPVEATRIRYWDTAGTEGDGDWTAGVKMARTPEGLLFVEHVARGQWSPGRREAEMRAVVEADGPGVLHWLEGETGIGAAERMNALKKVFEGYRLKIERPTGDKELRAEPFATQCELGNVRIVKGPWVKAYVDELLAFPRGTHDDQVDASSGACNKLVGRRVLKIGFG